MKLSVALAVLAMLVGLASAIEWWRASTVQPAKPNPPAPLPPVGLPPAPHLPRPPGVPEGGISMLGMHTQTQRSGEINSRAALYAGVGVMLSGASSVLGGFGY